MFVCNFLLRIETYRALSLFVSLNVSTLFHFISILLFYLLLYILCGFSLFIVVVIYFVLFFFLIYRKLWLCFIAVAITVALASMTTVDAEECGQEEFAKCAEPLEMLHLTSEFSIGAAKKEELDKLCQ